MWTIKRILIMLGGITVFMTGYAVYAYFLGGINGLIVLPERYFPLAQVEYTEKPPTEGETKEKFKRAFGPDSEESKRYYKLDIGSKGVLLAFDKFDFENGKIKLSPFDAALFRKSKGEDGFPEINTVHCDVAVLTPDRPVSNTIELTKCKIIGVELRGETTGIRLVNNRRTPEKTDDIELFITAGSLFYDEHQGLIWTEGAVRMQDFKTRPETRIDAIGMELKLTEDTGLNKPKTASKKDKESSMGGVESLLLKSNVDMHLYVDSNSGFLGGPAPAKAVASAKDQNGEKAHIVIKTYGRFFYDVGKEVAHFDAPKPDSSGFAVLDQVRVTRDHKVDDVLKSDQLLTDQLELHFRKKPDEGPNTTRDPQMPDKEIDTALARSKGKEVTLAMETENLEATGSELEYRSATATLGPQTILRGTAKMPMEAVKDGHKIYFYANGELHLVGADKNKNGQKAMAMGPGQIDIYDKTNPKNPYPNHAKWRDSLIATKEREGDKYLDVWTMTGDASFTDDEHKQALHGQRLQVWLESDARPGDSRAAPTSTAAKQKLHKIEAFEKVSLHHPSVIIRLTNHLAILFRNEAAPGARLPDSLPPAKTPMIGPAVTSTAPTVTLPVAKEPQPTVPQTITVVPTPTSNKRPIELTANDVLANMATIGEKQELETLYAKGAVHVHQDGDESKDKNATANGIDIRGEVLQLEHKLVGDTLYVFGAGKEDAHLKLGELLIMGPKVTINQERNFAEVEGAGAMNLPSDTSFEGGQAKKTKTRLTIHWNKHMAFDGTYARFEGGVLAYQDGARLKSESLDVALNRFVSFKEGQKASEQAAVEKILCHGQVWLEDDRQDAAGKRVFDRLEAKELAVDKATEQVIANGPSGKVWHLAFGGGEDPFSTQRPKTNNAASEVMKLTRVHFDGRMFSDKKGQARVAIFYDNVEVYHFPAIDPDAKMSPDAPPKDGFYMKCGILKLETRQAEGRTTQAMEAQNNVFFRTQEFYGMAPRVTYSEATDQIAFEGQPGNLAAIYRRQPGRAEYQEMRGTKLVYNRKTGQFLTDGVKVIQAQ